MFLQNLDLISKSMGYVLVLFTTYGRTEFSSGINAHPKALNFKSELDSKFHPIIDKIRRTYHISNAPRFPTVFHIKDLEIALKGYYVRGASIVVIIVSRDLNSFEEFKSFSTRDNLDLYLSSLARS